MDVVGLVAGPQQESARARHNHYNLAVARGSRLIQRADERATDRAPRGSARLRRSDATGPTVDLVRR